MASSRECKVIDVARKNGAKASEKSKLGGNPLEPGLPI